MIPLLLGILFGFLALLHIYWALGGTLGFEKSIPVQPDGNALFRPGPAVTLLVAAILLMIAAYFLGGWALMHDFRNLWSVPGWMIGIAFLLRSMGEFKYVGFFKKVRGSDFARMDTFIYSPLCLLISGVTIQHLIFLR